MVFNNILKDNLIIHYFAEIIVKEPIKILKCLDIN